MPDNMLKSQAFKLKGRLYTFTVLQLLHQDKQAFEQHLDEVIAQAPKLFDNTPVVLDCTAISENSIDLQDICRILRLRQILPVAIQGANPALSSIAQCMGLAVLNASASHDKSLLEETPEEQEPAVDLNRNKLLTTPVRSGQQVVGKGGDLVITAPVSHGAELLADGNIHVYGALRGRALAGISGNRKARIFCLSLEAELVSIAGFYRLSDAIDRQEGPCQIYLQDDHIQIEPLC
ncbi:septum site-determining protein MinC [Legionella spiritensis]|uniref:Probable septum site-determining protein MinC n=1 Tax=Legionella spiritensis TaxID=452 RepID=A0A0W0YYC8_LEGSP|nr:septum site-determining protein MinC [Legionella spiritensis]KTD61603.1 septum site determining protein MinC [Legionella spiritensis]SNV39467.1 septum site determining protein MinC [Legionella spiritensis]